jgi:hypothetical protein
MTFSARIRMPISDCANSRDFITKILGYKKITSLPNSMTVISDMLPILLALTHDGKFGGRINACNKGWYVEYFSIKFEQESNEHVFYASAMFLHRTRDKLDEVAIECSLFMPKLDSHRQNSSFV